MIKDHVCIDQINKKWRINVETTLKIQRWNNAELSTFKHSRDNVKGFNFKTASVIHRCGNVGTYTLFNFPIQTKYNVILTFRFDACLLGLIIWFVSIVPSNTKWIFTMDETKMKKKTQKGTPLSFYKKTTT